MKNSKNILNVCLALLVSILLCIGAIWIVDRGFHGSVKSWFAYLLYNTGWLTIKNVMIVGFFLIVLLFVTAIMLSAYLSARSQAKKEIRFLCESIGAVISSDGTKQLLPEKYSEIEIQLVNIKADAQKHRQLAEQEAQRKNDLITYLAHDLKTPLASVIGYLSLLDEAPDMPAAQKAKYTGVALNKAYRLEELINEFFDITRFNLQTLVLNKSSVHLSFMLAQMADEFYPILTPQGKSVAVTAPEELTVFADPDKLARVFNNILKNAAAYSAENSVIAIIAVQRAHQLTVTFTNRGDPIPQQKLDTIFEKFYRLDSARSSNTGGAGLGLAIAKEIVTAHGGTISAQSGPDRTVFTVTLPVGDCVKALENPPASQPEKR